jgi:hypothetical protein
MPLGCIWIADAVHWWLIAPSTTCCRAMAFATPVIMITTSLASFGWRDGHVSGRGQRCREEAMGDANHNGANANGHRALGHLGHVTAEEPRIGHNGFVGQCLVARKGKGRKKSKAGKQKKRKTARSTTARVREAREDPGSLKATCPVTGNYRQIRISNQSQDHMCKLAHISNITLYRYST